MNCVRCGSPVDSGDKFCKSCGAPVGTVNQPNVGVQSGSVNTLNNMNNAQPTYGYSGARNQNNGTNPILVGIIAVLVVGIIVALVILVPKLNNNDSNNTKTSTPDSGNTVAPVASTGTKVEYSGYTFNIPDDVKYSLSDGYLYVADYGVTWAAKMAVINGDFNTLDQNKSLLKSELEANGYKIGTVETKTYAGLKILTLEAEVDSAKSILAYAKISSNQIICFELAAKSNTYKYDSLNTIAKIISSAKSSSNSFSTEVEFGTNIDLNKLPTE